MYWLFIYELPFGSCYLCSSRISRCQLMLGFELSYVLQNNSEANSIWLLIKADTIIYMLATLDPAHYKQSGPLTFETCMFDY